MKELIRAENLSLTYQTAAGETEALRDVSFSYVPQRPLIEHLELNVQPGQRVAIVGPTGCGKTALVREAAGIVGLPFVSFDATSLSETG